MRGEQTDFFSREHHPQNGSLTNRQSSHVAYCLQLDSASLNTCSTQQQTESLYISENSVSGFDHVAPVISCLGDRCRTIPPWTIPPGQLPPGQFPLPFWVGHFPPRTIPPICYAYIHTHVCIHTHTHTYIHTYTHIQIHTYIH